MGIEDFYKNTSPYLWNSDSWQKDEGFYGKEDMKRFAEEYHQAKLKELTTPDERGDELNTLNEKPPVSDFVISLTLKDITKIVNAFSDFNIPVEAVKEEIELIEDFKQCNIPDVVGQSEQLIAFSKWKEEKGYHPIYDHKGLVEEYLKSL